MTSEGEKHGVYGRYRIASLIIIGIAIVILLEIYIFPMLESIYPVLANYDRYVRDATVAVVIFGVAFLILRVLRKAVEISSRKAMGRNYHGVYTVLRAIIYGIAIALFLAYAGVSLTGALIGGTIGGLILSFALQNTVSSLLSGLLLATAGVVKPKEKVSFYSWLFDNPVLGEVIDVKLLTVQVRTIDGYFTELPNSALLAQAQFTNLGVGREIQAVLSVSVPVDAQIGGIMDIARKRLDSAKGETGILGIEAYFFSKAFNSNTIKVITRFANIGDYNRIVNAVNLAYEEAYWEMKNRAPQGNNILLGFAVDVPVNQLIAEGNSILDSRTGDAGIESYSSYFFSKAFNSNTIKVAFRLSGGASYDSVADAINASYEEAYTRLRESSQKQDQ